LVFCTLKTSDFLPARAKTRRRYLFCYDNRMWPKVSFIIPTLNSHNVLEPCLESISIQNYPKDQIEIIIADGGSSDDTLEISNKYGSFIVSNTLKTAESGKSVGLMAATGDFVVLVDSDNELPHALWLQNMIAPLVDHIEAVGSEPLEYTWRPQDGFIARYCALIGMNDPLVLFLGNYDRKCLVSNKWTEVPHSEVDYEKYILVTFDKTGLPTIGANGTVFRTEFLKKFATGDYIFDIDILAGVIEREGKVNFIKVKESIVHTFCESDIKKFKRKQGRRIADFIFHRSAGTRNYPWEKINYTGYLKFVVSCVTLIPLIVQSVKGYTRKKDTAWFFHVLACEITLWEYSLGVLKSLFIKSEYDRTKWSQ